MTVLRNTAAVIDSKPIAVSSPFISEVIAFNPLVPFNDIHEINGEVLFFCSLQHLETGHN
jgi:hypothetical protein